MPGRTGPRNDTQTRPPSCRAPPRHRLGRDGLGHLRPRPRRPGLPAHAAVVPLRPAARPGAGRRPRLRQAAGRHPPLRRPVVAGPMLSARSCPGGGMPAAGTSSVQPRVPGHSSGGGGPRSAARRPRNASSRQRSPGSAASNNRRSRSRRLPANFRGARTASANSCSMALSAARTSASRTHPRPATVLRHGLVLGVLARVRRLESGQGIHRMGPGDQ